MDSYWDGFWGILGVITGGCVFLTGCALIDTIYIWWQKTTKGDAN